MIYDARETSNEVPTWQVCYVEMASVVPGLLLAFMETLILAALSVAISTRLPMFANFMICFTVYVLGHLIPLISQATEGRFEIVKFVGRFSAAIFPNLEAFDLQTAIAAYDEVSQLAQVAQENIAADRESYDQSLTATRGAVFAAEKAIQKARWAVKEPDARNAGWHALQRAENALAQIGSLESATIEALARLRRSAQQAEADALRAESQARQALDRVQAERRRRLATVGGAVTPSIVLGSRPRSARRSSSRKKSPWRSTSTRGTSRRTTSRSSSKRK